MKKSHSVVSVQFRLIILLFTTLFCCASVCTVYGQGGKDWKVWVKTSPCSGRFDWISVAKENPTTSGLNYYQLANVIFPQTNCTTFGCSFADATRVANTLKFNEAFFNYDSYPLKTWGIDNTWQGAGNITSL